MRVDVDGVVATAAALLDRYVGRVEVVDPGRGYSNGQHVTVRIATPQESGGGDVCGEPKRR